MHLSGIEVFQLSVTKDPEEGFTAVFASILDSVQGQLCHEQENQVILLFYYRIFFVFCHLFHFNV